MLTILCRKLLCKQVMLKSLANISANKQENVMLKVYYWCNCRVAMKRLQAQKKSRTLTRVVSMMLCLLVVFVLGVFAARSERASAFSGQGAGSAADPFQITACDQLQEIQENRTAHYILTQDIDCTASRNYNSDKGFMPIGRGDPNGGFWGVLDGRNHTITNLYVTTWDGSNDKYGLFTQLESGSVVRNLKFT